jgi:beta-glucanase (GH16 family)
MNWILKQLFYLRYFTKRIWFIWWQLEYRRQIIFQSDSFRDGQWNERLPWDEKTAPINYNTYGIFSQQYGKFFFKARMDGLIEQNGWPAIWLYDERSKEDVKAGKVDHAYYYEIDFELCEKMKNFFAVNFHFNHSGGYQEPGYKKFSSRFRIRKFMRNLQKDYHLFLIDWNKDWIKFYINGILCARFRNEINVPMQIIMSRMSMEKTIIQNG